MREKVTRRIINPARPFCSQIVYCFVSTEVNEALKYSFQRLRDFLFCFLFFLITKHEICVVLGLDLMLVHHRVDCKIRRTRHPLG